MVVNSYKDLKVWQKSMELAYMVYELVKNLPKEELYALSNRMRRAVISIPSNMAEGFYRTTTREYIRFLSISKGSLGELETQIYLCEGPGYVKEDQTAPILQKCDETGKMLTSLIKNQQSKLNSGEQI